MKILKVVMALAVAALFISGCSDDKPAPAAQETAASAPEAAPMAGEAIKIPTVGTIIETMNSGGYTYVNIDNGSGETFWVAAPEVAVSVGEVVSISGASPMPGYYSTTLDRTFPMLFFAGAIVPSNGSVAPAMGADGSMPVSSGRNVVAAQDVSGVEPLEGGVTVGDLYAKKAELAGKEVKLRGKVVKVSRGIMGKTWIHVQDGTGGEKENDLTVTTNGDAQVGDIVVVTGKPVVDKDFGMGYFYDLIIEDGIVAPSK
ncbi:MAG: DNA-binding protein [Deltaproteobacteria bacterium]|nr:MAG: DNA-binding protein [Deltaproteobacteria bacterium]